jgi:hypothetical protein
MELDTYALISEAQAVRVRLANLREQIARERLRNQELLNLRRILHVRAGRKIAPPVVL